jgi:RimJ/RimL family protein N-acetyltransferase
MAEIQAREITWPSSEHLIIRCAVTKDAASLRNHILSIQINSDVVVTQPHEYPRSVDAQARWIEEYRSSPTKLALIAELSGDLIGELNFSNYDRERLSHVGSFGMSVGKAHRGKGVGKELLSTLLAWARANPKIEKVGLAVFSSNDAAIKLYRKMGFCEEGRRPKEIRLRDNCYVDDVLMYQFTKDG